MVCATSWGKAVRAYMSTGVEVGHELFGSDPGELVFECFEFFPEGLNIIERDLDGAVVDFAGASIFRCSSHVLRCPCLDRYAS